LNKSSIFKNIDIKKSFYRENPFKKLSIKIKQEIVPMGDPEVRPAVNVGEYIDPADWDNFILDKNTVVIDMRNDFEVKMGSFEDSVNPGTENFRDFPAWWQKNKRSFGGKKIAMFCTGGIRCEKSTSYIIKDGTSEVFHLKGGILNYFEKIVPSEKSKWQGECFVFDQRVSLTNELNSGSFELCFGCRNPITKADKKHRYYEHGVTCPKCHCNKNEKQMLSLRERQKQISLKAERTKKRKGL
jgi:UPF0176 protein